jgi:hypothetical protein
MQPQTFQVLLKQIMKRNNLSQRALAAAANVDHVYLCRMLKPQNQHKPKHTIHKLVEHVGCTDAERIRLYQLAGVLPPEYLEAFFEGRLSIRPRKEKTTTQRTEN